MANLGLLARWQMDSIQNGTVLDSSTFSPPNNGILRNWSSDDVHIPSIFRGGDGKLPSLIDGPKPNTKALHFGGCACVEIPSMVNNAPRLQPCVLSVEVWVRGKSPIAPGEAVPSIVTMGIDPCSAGAYGIGAANGIDFYVSNRSRLISASYTDIQSIWDGRWHHVAGTWDGRRVTLYVDGTQRSQTDALTIDNTANNNYAIDYNLVYTKLNIGAFQAGDVDPGCKHGFIGDIGPVCIWQGALSPTEITSRFAGHDI